MNKCDFCGGYINDKCLVGDDKLADCCKEARQIMSKFIKDGKVIKIDRYRTRINGVDKLNDIEICLNQIGHENIMHISTIGEDMLVVYRGEADIL
ncbi:MAG: hypothetical protein J1E81_06100 [Eubacterium sp.]|nr:hypothetical protein [Eubacterium sp.]